MFPFRRDAYAERREIGRLRRKLEKRGVRAVDHRQPLTKTIPLCPTLSAGRFFLIIPRFLGEVLLWRCLLGGLVSSSGKMCQRRDANERNASNRRDETTRRSRVS